MGNNRAVAPIRPRVVLADDLPQSLSTWKKLLQDRCSLVAMAADGVSALEAIRRFKPELAVLDLSMPGLSGLDVARKAIAEQPSIGIILCSIIGDPDTMEEAGTVGIRGYVSKVNASHQLMDAVTAVAGGGKFFPPPIPLPYLPKQETNDRLIHLGNSTKPVQRASQAEIIQALRQSEFRLRLALEANSEGVWDWNIPTGKAYFSERYARILGYESSEFPTDYAGWKELVHPDDFEMINQAHAAHIHDGKEFCVEFRMRRKTGGWCWVRSRAIVIERDAGGNAIRMIGTHLDITEQKRAEEAMVSFGRRLIEAHEEERTWIGRELHDDICQRLALLAVELKSCAQQLPARNDVQNMLQRSQERIAEIGKDVQSLSHRLHSSKLEYLGLVAAANGFCRELSEQKKVEIRFTHSGIPSVVPKEVSLCVFRVLQEALQNAVKHSGVEQFAVTLTGREGYIELTVSDAGTGFQEPDAMAGKGLGLISMRERVMTLDGTLSIISKPKHGTKIKARVPSAPKIAGCA